jgi:hypothetical protein
MNPAGKLGGICNQEACKPDPKPELESGLFPSNAVDRKKLPVGTGVLDYFASALIEVARVSFVGNEQHNPGQPLHWDRSKSSDEWDTVVRHGMDRGKIDTDGVRHSAKMCWRALAILQKEMEEAGAPISRAATNVSQK